MTNTLTMELRSVDETTRTVTGLCVPYNETSYLTPSPAGERIVRGAFRKSARERTHKVFLFREHDHANPVGRAVRFEDGDDGLIGEFAIRKSTLGDLALADVLDGYLPALSVGFKPLKGAVRRGSDGASEVLEASLIEVSLCAIGAYEGARVLSVRGAQLVEWETPPPGVDLAPILPFWAQ